MWRYKSRSGATIEDAIQFLMSVDPKDEDVTQAAPLVATAAAAYGDPDNRYLAFLENISPNYRYKPFWFMNQAQSMEGSRSAKGMGAFSEDALVVEIDGTVSSELDCPDIFKTSGPEGCELEPGLFVTCEMLSRYL